MANTPLSIVRYVVHTNDGHWIWTGPLSCPESRRGRSGMKIMTFNPRPEIYIQGKKTVPQRVFFEQIHGRPPQGRLQRLKTVCSIPMCVNPDCFQETAPTAPPAPSGELDGDFEAIRQSLQADIDNGIPYRPPHYEMWEEEIVVVVQHHPHIAAWMATGPR